MIWETELKIIIAIFCVCITPVWQIGFPKKAATRISIHMLSLKGDIATPLTDRWDLCSQPWNLSGLWLQRKRRYVPSETRLWKVMQLPPGFSWDTGFWNPAATLWGSPCHTERSHGGIPANSLSWGSSRQPAPSVRHLSEKIPKKKIKIATCLLLVASDNRLKERNKPKKDLLNLKEPGFSGFEIIFFFYIHPSRWQMIPKLTYDIQEIQGKKW